MSKDNRSIVYVRAIKRPALYFRVIGGEFHLIERILRPDGSEQDDYFIRTGDIVIVTIRNRKESLPINEFVDLTDIPETLVKYEKEHPSSKRKPTHR